MIRKKYQKEEKELLNELSKLDGGTYVIEIKAVGISKVKDNIIYECKFVEHGDIKNVTIIAQNVTQALAKLEPYVNSGVPEAVLKQMLGNERYV